MKNSMIPSLTRKMKTTMMTQMMMKNTKVLLLIQVVVLTRDQLCIVIVEAIGANLLVLIWNPLDPNDDASYHYH